MVIVNGKVYHGNVTIINGHVISEGPSDNTSGEKIDEVKKESANGVRNIIISSDINVKISASDTNDVTAHMHGSGIMGKSPQLSVTRVGNEIRVCVECFKNFSNNSINIVSNSINIVTSNCKLFIDIQIPNKKFDILSVQGKNANIDISRSVNTNKIDIESKNGNADIFAIFNTLSAECKNGNINVDSKAVDDVILNLISKNGNVDVSVSNIGVSKVFVEAKNGTSRNIPKLGGIYTAYGCISSKNGNAKFH